MIPGAPWAGTYRLQLTPAFTFRDASGVMPYLARLGVSHAYLSPVFEARAGSTHGYDGVDPTRLRVELGGDAGFRELALAARRAGLGILLDIVPNHLAADYANPWWRDVLRRGRDSPFAPVFDIDWEAGGGRVNLPVLGSPLAETIAGGELRIEQDPEDGQPRLRYHDHLFPIARADGVPASASADLLDNQWYRLVHWREAAAALNYRRFFDITHLVGVRVEDAAVFDLTHGAVISLVEQGLVDGLRIDHIDGLRDPAEYLRRLRSRLMDAAPQRHVPVLVEKILAPGESLPAAWPVDGTTGYEFLAASAHLPVNGEGARAIRAAAGAPPGHFARESLRAKREVARTTLAPELARLGRLFWRAAALAGIEQPGMAEADEAIAELAARLPRYRTYGDARGLSDDDRRLIEASRDAALSDDGPALVRAVTDALLGRPPFAGGAARGAALEFLLSWQQYTGPVAAKGVEDRALYRDTSVAALCDVGCEPEPVEDAAAEMVRVLGARAGMHAGCLNATSSHDSKRSEDARARMAAMTRRPADWLGMVDRWKRDHAPLKAALPRGTAPVESDELLLYQTLLALASPGRSPLAGVGDRARAYMRKAAREAALRTTWTDPDEKYEQALDRFVTELCEGPGGHGFRADLQRLAAEGGAAGRGEWSADSLALVLLRALAPGVPDVYQGCELWDVSLVDPDNRRPVDFERRASLLAWTVSLWESDPARCAQALMRVADSGAPKLLALWRGLACRRWLLEGGGPAVDQIGSGAGLLWWSVSAGPRRLIALTARGGRSRPPVPAMLARAWPREAAMDQMGGRLLRTADEALAVLIGRGSLPCAVVLEGVATLLHAPSRA